MSTFKMRLFGIGICDPTWLTNALWATSFEGYIVTILSHYSIEFTHYF